MFCLYDRVAISIFESQYITILQRHALQSLRINSKSCLSICFRSSSQFFILIFFHLIHWQQQTRPKSANLFLFTFLIDCWFAYCTDRYKQSENCLLPIQSKPDQGSRVFFWTKGSSWNASSFVFAFIDQHHSITTTVILPILCFSFAFDEYFLGAYWLIFLLIIYKTNLFNIEIGIIFGF